MEGGKEFKQCVHYAGGERKNCLNTTLFRRKKESNVMYLGIFGRS